MQVDLSITSAKRAIEGESVCGDSCGWWVSGGRTVLALADGLGHGGKAAQAAEAALACIGANLEEDCETIFHRCDAALRDTRGAALALAIIDSRDGRLTIATVGNIRALLLSDQADLRLDGTRGIVGAGYRRLVPETLPLLPGNTLALFSDGVEEFPALRDFFGESAWPMDEQAQRFLERWGRSDDDASILVCRHLG